MTRQSFVKIFIGMILPCVSVHAAEEMVFNIIMKTTAQWGSECGFWFSDQGVQANKPKLVIEYSQNGQKGTKSYQHGLNGMQNAFGYYIGPLDPDPKHDIFTKKRPARNGLFWCDISDIPIGAAITKATLHLHIHTKEGFCGGDVISVISVHEGLKKWNWDFANWNQYDDGKPWDTSGGDFGPFIREIRAKEDITDRGFKKGNPNADFDFTEYVKKLQSSRDGTTPPPPPPPPPSTPGDANQDGSVSMADLNLLVDWILGRAAPPAPGSTAFANSDVSGDGAINMSDLNRLVDFILGRIPALKPGS